MRVLHIGLSCFPGGVENFVRNYYLALKDEEIVFDFVDIYGDGLAFVDEFARYGSRFYTIPNYKKHPMITKCRLAKIISNYSCVHIHLLSAASIITVKSAKAAGVVPIVHTHNSNTVGLLRQMLHRFHIKALRSIPSFHVACSKEAGRWMWGDTKFTVIPNAIDTQRFRFQKEARQQVRTQMQCSDKNIVVGFVGRLSEQKNPLFALHVFDRFHSIHPNSQLWFVGEGYLETAVRKELEKLNCADSVRFLGYRNDIPQLMAAMDVLLFPSVFEGFAITLMEAQAAGLPIVSADTVVTDSIILESTKQLSLTESIEDWSSALSTAVGSTDRAVSALKIAEAGYDIYKVAGCLADLYHSCQ